MNSSSTLTRFLVGLSAFVLLGVGIRLMYYGLRTELTPSPSWGVLAFIGGIICFVGGLVVGVLLFDAYSRRT
jgi:hypothetical protein